jgi:hypothetical protein
MPETSLRTALSPLVKRNLPATAKKKGTANLEAAPTTCPKIPGKGA